MSTRSVGLAKDALAGINMKQAAEERFKAAGSSALDSFLSGNSCQSRPRPKKRKRPPLIRKKIKNNDAERNIVVCSKTSTCQHLAKIMNVDRIHEKSQETVDSSLALF